LDATEPAADEAHCVWISAEVPAFDSWGLDTSMLLWSRPPHQMVLSRGESSESNLANALTASEGVTVPLAEWRVARNERTDLQSRGQRY
jgi:hypothetical protein